MEFVLDNLFLFSFLFFWICIIFDAFWNLLFKIWISLFLLTFTTFLAVWFESSNETSSIKEMIVSASSLLFTGMYPFSLGLLQHNVLEYALELFRRIFSWVFCHHFRYIFFSYLNWQTKQTMHKKVTRKMESREITIIGCCS